MFFYKVTAGEDDSWFVIAGETYTLGIDPEDLVRRGSVMVVRRVEGAIEMGFVAGLKWAQKNPTASVPDFPPEWPETDWYAIFSLLFPLSYGAGDFDFDEGVARFLEEHGDCESEGAFILWMAENAPELFGREPEEIVVMLFGTAHQKAALMASKHEA